MRKQPSKQCSYRHQLACLGVASVILFGGCTDSNARPQKVVAPSLEYDLSTVALPSCDTSPKFLPIRNGLYEMATVDLQVAGGTPGEVDQVWVLRDADIDASKDKLPCVFVAAAGATTISGVDMTEKQMANYQRLASLGFVVVGYGTDGATSVETKEAEFVRAHYKYRSSMAGLINARNAIVFVRRKVPCVDFERLYALGHDSAGKQALLLATHDKRIKAVVSIAGYSSIVAATKPNEITGFDTLIPDWREFAKKASPMTHESSLTCPVMVIHSTLDKFVSSEHSAQLAARLTKSGVPVKSHIEARGSHGAIDAKVNVAASWLMRVDSKFAKGHQEFRPSPPDELYDGQVEKFEQLNLTLDRENSRDGFQRYFLPAVTRDAMIQDSRIVLTNDSVGFVTYSSLGGVGSICRSKGLPRAVCDLPTTEGPGREFAFASDGDLAIRFSGNLRRRVEISLPPNRASNDREPIRFHRLASSSSRDEPSVFFSLRQGNELLPVVGKLSLVDDSVEYKEMKWPDAANKSTEKQESSAFPFKMTMNDPLTPDEMKLINPELVEVMKQRERDSNNDFSKYAGRHSTDSINILYMLWQRMERREARLIEMKLRGNADRAWYLQSDQAKWLAYQARLGRDFAEQLLHPADSPPIPSLCLGHLMLSVKPTELSWSFPFDASWKSTFPLLPDEKWNQAKESGTSQDLPDGVQSPRCIAVLPFGKELAVVFSKSIIFVDPAKLDFPITTDVSQDSEPRIVYAKQKSKLMDYDESQEVVPSKVRFNGMEADVVREADGYFFSLPEAAVGNSRPFLVVGREKASDRPTLRFLELSVLPKVIATPFPFRRLKPTENSNQILGLGRADGNTIQENVAHERPQFDRFAIFDLSTEKPIASHQLDEKFLDAIVKGRSVFVVFKKFKDNRIAKFDIHDDGFEKVAEVTMKDSVVALSSSDDDTVTLFLDGHVPIPSDQTDHKALVTRKLNATDLSETETPDRVGRRHSRGNPLTLLRAEVETRLKSDFAFFSTTHGVVKNAATQIDGEVDLGPKTYSIENKVRYLRLIGRGYLPSFTTFEIRHNQVPPSHTAPARPIRALGKIWTAVEDQLFSFDLADYQEREPNRLDPLLIDPMSVPISFSTSQPLSLQYRCEGATQMVFRLECPVGSLEPIVDRERLGTYTLDVDVVNQFVLDSFVRSAIVYQQFLQGEGRKTLPKKIDVHSADRLPAIKAYSQMMREAFEHATGRKPDGVPHVLRVEVLAKGDHREYFRLSHMILVEIEPEKLEQSLAKLSS